MPIEERISRLYLRHQAMLREYIRALVHHPADADDLLQETGLTILSRAKVPDDDQIFPAWARGVARNTVLHFWRTTKRAIVIPDSRLLDVVALSFAEADADQEAIDVRRQALVECVKQTKDPAATLLRMRYVDGLACEKVAQLLRKTPVAVRVMLLRIRTALARCIESRLSASQA